MSQDSERARPSPRGQLTRVEVQPSQVVAAAGGAIVTAAKVGRILGRSGWRLARQLPGARLLEREAQRLQASAAHEARRFLQVPHGPNGGAPTTVEHSAAADVADVRRRVEPLRNAMGELLDRSVEATRTDSREYLYRTIISQLVPDEARILAALSDGAGYAAVDLVQRQRRGKSRIVLADASTLGRQAGLVTPDSTPTYLGRLRTFGLIQFGPETTSLSSQYDVLAEDPAVAKAREETSGSTRLERKTVTMSTFGHQFWRASDPSRQAAP